LGFGLLPKNGKIGLAYKWTRQSDHGYFAGVDDGLRGLERPNATDGNGGNRYRLRDRLGFVDKIGLARKRDRLRETANNRR
jgi:hypothetical protein